MADVESKSIPHELPSCHWLKATGQCVLERYLSATMHLICIFLPMVSSIYLHLISHCILSICNIYLFPVFVLRAGFAF